MLIFGKEFRSQCKRHERKGVIGLWNGRYPCMYIVGILNELRMTNGGLEIQNVPRLSAL